MTCRSRCLGCALAVAAIVAVASIRAEPSNLAGQHWTRKILVTEAGPQSLAVDLELLAGAQPSLSDLRLFDEQEHEVPYLVVPPRTAEPRWRQAAVVRSITAGSGESGFEAEFARVERFDRIRIEGLAPPLMKRLRLEGSTASHRYSSLVTDATVFDLPDDGLRQLELEFEPGEFKTVRGVWDDKSSSPVGLPRSVLLRLDENRIGAAPLRAAVAFEQRASRVAVSQWRIRLPAAGLPITAIELSTKQEQLLRGARISESRLENGRLESHQLGTATLRRASRSGMVADNLRIPVAPPLGNELTLAVDNGNNPPLSLDQIRVELRPQPHLYFEAAKAGTYVARYGAKNASAPRYDLEAERDNLAARQLLQARWAGAPRESGAPPPVPNQPPSTPGASHGSTLEPSRFAYSRAILGDAEGMVSVRLDAAVLAHSRDLTDVRILDVTSRQVPFLIEHESEPLVVDLVPEPVSAEPYAGQLGGRYSMYRVRLPYTGLPSSRLVLLTEHRIFRRQVSVYIERVQRQGKPPRLEPIARETWIHADPSQGPAPLALVVVTGSAQELLLAVEEGDNDRLALKSSSLELPAHSLRFFRQRGEALRLFYGDATLSTPNYDLALLASELRGMTTLEVSLAPEQAQATVAPVVNRLAKWFWVVLVLTVLALIALIARLIRKTDSSEPGTSG